MFDIDRTNTVVYCAEWLETVCFYRDTLGLPVNFANDWFFEFKLAPNSFLSVANAATASIDSVYGQGITLSWQVANLCELRNRLRLKNIQTTAIQRKWNADVLYFHDPEGHRIELWEPLPDSTEVNCDLATSVPDWLVEYPELLNLFQSLGIDYSCGGKSLETAIQQRGLDSGEVLQQVLKTIEVSR